MTTEQCTALVAALLLTRPNMTSDAANPKARANAIEAAARLVQESAALCRRLFEVPPAA